MSVSFTFEKATKPTASAKKSALTAYSRQVREEEPSQIAADPKSVISPEERVEELKSSGNALAEEGKFVKALLCWDQALSIDPKNPVLHELKAQVLLEMGEDELALEEATQATTFGENWSDAHLTLARVLRNSGLLDLSKQSMIRALELAKSQSDINGRPQHGNSSSQLIELELDELLFLIQLSLQRSQAEDSIKEQKANTTRNDCSEGS